VPYTPTTWVDDTGVGDGTVINATRLNNIESGIVAANTTGGTLDTWHTVGATGEPAFQNGWVNYGAGEQVVQYRKDPFGKVMLRGVAKTGTINTVGFTLPAGYRPPGLVRFANIANGSASYSFVDTAGAVVFSTTTNVFADVAPIEFDTDTVTTYLAGIKGDVGPVGPAGAGLSAYEGAVQPGVLAATDCGPLIAFGSTTTVPAGVVYVRDVAGVLVRTTPVSTQISTPQCANAANFRLDQFVINSAGVISRLAGTEGPTVTLDNRTGSAPIPAGSQLLYDSLANGAGVGPTIRDRRPNARGASYSVARIAGADYTRLATTFDWVDATNLRFRIECSGARLKLRVMGSMFAGSSATEVSAYLGWMESLSGVTTHVDGTGRGFWVNNQIYRSFIYETTIFPTTGSHIYGPVFRGDGTNTVTLGAQVNWPLIVEYEEIMRGNFNNGTS
jgi:hypothetical protein